VGAAENPEATFLARMTASTTHELRNVLAVVKESAGLVEDLTLASQQGKPVSSDKFLHAARRIDAQVARGAALLTSLNRLAHGLDHAEQSLDLGEHVEHVASLCQRFARQGRQRIELDTSSETRAVRTNALRLQMAIVSAIDCCLEQLPEESVVTLRVAGSGDRPCIVITGAATKGAPPAPAGAASWPRLVALLDQLSASVEAGDEPFGFRLVFSGSAG
jgi:C4-dicarboxylate-specific signal transduction histidine kinase